MDRILDGSPEKFQAETLQRIRTIVDGIPFMDYAVRDPGDATWPDDMSAAVRHLERTGRTDKLKAAIRGMPAAGKKYPASYWYEQLPALIRTWDANVIQEDASRPLAEKGNVTRYEIH